jgi:Flp pilus assembly protein TadD
MRKLFLILVSLTFILFLGYVGFRGYKVWKQNRMMNLARSFAEKGDGTNAVLALQQVLRSNPRHLDACRMMANYTQLAGSYGAVLWRSRVVELNPHSTEDRIALAQTAILFRDFGTATNALDGIDSAGKKTFDYHNISGALAAAMNELDIAKAQFQEAIHLEPSNAAVQISMAVIHLNSTNALDKEQARISLKRVATNPTNANLRCRALRELIGDAMRSNESSTALAFANELLKQTNSMFSDRLLHLDILFNSTNAEFKTALMACRKEAVSDSAKMHEIGSWQILRTPPGEFLEWLLSLPDTIRTNQPAALFIAECHMMLGNWAILQSTLQRQNWVDNFADLNFLRHAFIARALRGQNLEPAAKSEWDIALRGASDKKPCLFMLLRFAATWKWINETESLLGIIVNRFPEEKWATTALMQSFFEQGRTRALMNLLNQEHKRAPDDLGLKNNLALTALLLDAQEFKPHEMIRDVYQKSGTNPAFASTYAFSLYLQKKYSEACDVMDRLPSAQLEDPSTAGYYAMVLKSSGKAVKAQKYFDLSTKAKLLPEERKIIDKVRSP